MRVFVCVDAEHLTVTMQRYLLMARFVETCALLLCVICAVL